MKPTTSPNADLSWHDQEEFWLAPYAMRSVKSRGRQYPESEHPYRSIFQRDRERIVHCTAFRRLMGKTQVLVAQINDHHRTRLTHTLEVAQISRTIARRLRLNEDLVEAIALSHDLGHPPFGHAGEAALDECMHDHSGFDHNLFGLRLVEEREERYPEFPGLNLSYEVRAAFVHHSKKKDAPETTGFEKHVGPLLEAQLVDAADSLAYLTHDIDDALGTGLVEHEDLLTVPMWSLATRKVQELYPGMSGAPLRTAMVRHLISWQVSDMVEETLRRLKEHHITSVEDVTASKLPLIEFGPTMCELKVQMEAFLLEHVYKHFKVMRMGNKGKHFLRELFKEYCAHPELLPARHLRRWVNAPARALPKPGSFVHERGIRCDPIERVVTDYIAGMTDRFAQQEYVRLFHPSPEL